jgi:hypothetical protein
MDEVRKMKSLIIQSAMTNKEAKITLSEDGLHIGIVYQGKRLEGLQAAPDDAHRLYDWLGEKLGKTRALGEDTPDLAQRVDELQKLLQVKWEQNIRAHHAINERLNRLEQPQGKEDEPKPLAYDRNGVALYQDDVLYNHVDESKGILRAADLNDGAIYVQPTCGKKNTTKHRPTSFILYRRKESK